jgi:hypothetical protein
MSSEPTPVKSDRSPADGEYGLTTPKLFQDCTAPASMFHQPSSPLTPLRHKVSAKPSAS